MKAEAAAAIKNNYHYTASLQGPLWSGLMEQISCHAVHFDNAVLHIQV